MYCCDSCCTLHICIFEPEKYLIVKGVKKMVMMMMMMMTQECGCMAFHGGDDMVEKDGMPAISSQDTGLEPQTCAREKYKRK